jgi:flagellar motor switch protein FliN/FliY
MSQGEEPVSQNEIDSLLNQSRRKSDGGAADGPAAPIASAGGPGPSDAGASDAGGVSQDEIEALLQAAAKSPAATKAAPTPAAKAKRPEAVGNDVELLLRKAEEAIASISDPVEREIGARNFTFQEFKGAPPSTERTTIELLRDVELDLRIELGRTTLSLEDVLQLQKGAVVPLDKLAGDPVDVFVNGRLIAQGEVLVLNDNFCVRIADLISPDDAA